MIRPPVEEISTLHPSPRMELLAKWIWKLESRNADLLAALRESSTKVVEHHFVTPELGRQCRIWGAHGVFGLTAERVEEKKG